jgi:hypothetical protein
MPAGLDGSRLRTSGLLVPLLTPLWHSSTYWISCAHQTGPRRHRVHLMANKPDRRASRSVCGKTHGQVLKPPRWPRSEVPPATWQPRSGLPHLMLFRCSYRHRRPHQGDRSIYRTQITGPRPPACRAQVLRSTSPARSEAPPVIKKVSGQGDAIDVVLNYGGKHMVRSRLIDAYPLRARPRLSGRDDDFESG